MEDDEIDESGLEEEGGPGKDSVAQTAHLSTLFKSGMMSAAY